MDENSKVATLKKKKDNKNLPGNHKNDLNDNNDSNENDNETVGKKQEQLGNDILQEVSCNFNSNNSPVKKIFHEANKILKIGMANEFALFEKDSTIQVC